MTKIKLDIAEFDKEAPFSMSDTTCVIFRSKEDWDLCAHSQAEQDRVNSANAKKVREQGHFGGQSRYPYLATSEPERFPCIAIQGYSFESNDRTDTISYTFIYDFEAEKTFTVYWKDGTKSAMKGFTIEEAFRNEGYGGGASSAVDWYDNGETDTHDWNLDTKTWVRKPTTAEFLCSLNKKHTNEEVLSFAIKVPYNKFTEDPHSEDVKRRAQIQACDSGNVEAAGITGNWGNQYWMGAVCMEPKED